MFVKSFSTSHSYMDIAHLLGSFMLFLGILKWLTCQFADSIGGSSQQRKTQRYTCIFFLLESLLFITEPFGFQESPHRIQAMSKEEQGRGGPFSLPSQLVFPLTIPPQARRSSTSDLSCARTLFVFDRLKKEAPALMRGALEVVSPRHRAQHVLTPEGRGSPFCWVATTRLRLRKPSWPQCWVHSELCKQLQPGDPLWLEWALAFSPFANRQT